MSWTDEIQKRRSEELGHESDDAFYLGPGYFEIPRERYIPLFPNFFCNKTETPEIRLPVLYERQDGRYARNIFELRTWKAKRAMDLLQVGCCLLISQRLAVGAVYWQGLGSMIMCCNGHPCTYIILSLHI